MATDVKAHITGTVWKVETSVGASVSEGQVLVILESMKMEMPIEAPCDGTVKEVLVKEGEPVDEGKVVVTLG
jgi:acetyl-CoA carboxylase biotin carboxyl carrier protein